MRYLSTYTTGFTDSLLFAQLHSRIAEKEYGVLLQGCGFDKPKTKAEANQRQKYHRI